MEDTGSTFKVTDKKNAMLQVKILKLFTVIRPPDSDSHDNIGCVFFSLKCTYKLGKELMNFYLLVEEQVEQYVLRNL